MLTLQPPLAVQYTNLVRRRETVRDRERAVLLEAARDLLRLRAWRDTLRDTLRRRLRDLPAAVDLDLDRDRLPPAAFLLAAERRLALLLAIAASLHTHAHTRSVCCWTIIIDNGLRLHCAI